MRPLRTTHIATKQGRVVEVKELLEDTPQRVRVRGLWTGSMSLDPKIYEIPAGNVAYRILVEELV